MDRTRRALVILPLFWILFAFAPGASAQNQLNPEFCSGTSVLPWGYQAWQAQRTWMGIAVAPGNPTQSVHLEIMQGFTFTDTTGYSPRVVSEYDNATNFLVKDFATVPDQWVLAKVYNPLLGNLTSVTDWDPGQGALLPGTGQTFDYGGLTGGCGLIRVFKVALTSGQSYRFHLTRDNAGDDVRMALLWSGSLPDGWVGRSDALFEKTADVTGSGSPETFTPTHTGNHALVVFVNDITASGGQYTVSFEEYTPPSNEPDLVITGITPHSAISGSSVTATIFIENQGTAEAAACVTEVTFDGNVTCAAISTPAIAAGASNAVQCSLGTPLVGYHSVHAIVDSGSSVAESDETNNEMTDNLHILNASLPDLVISTVGPTTVVPNRNTQIAVAVHNDGNQDAAACITLYSVDGGATTVQIATPAIAAGGNTVVSGILPGLSEGSHSVVVIVDFADVVAEADDGNNDYGFTLQVEGPNLVIDSITPATVYGNGAPNFQITVRNTGTVASIDSYTKLTVDGAIECAAIATPSVGAGATVTVECPGSTLAPGTHAVEACADKNYLVLESNENDNCLSVAVEMIPTSTVVYADGSGYYATIQTAIDAIPDGSEILLVGGTTYSGPGNRDLDFHGKDLIVVAAFGGGAIIDCGGDPETLHRAFYFHSGETRAATVRSLVIINGWEENRAGGGISIGDAEPTIQDCIIWGCHAYEGGAIAVSATNSVNHPLITACTMTGNVADFGDAVHVSKNGGPEFTNCIISSNYGYYGAVICNNSLGNPQPTFSCTDIWGNGGGDWTGCISGMLGVDNNFSQDPLFCDAGAHDYSLASNSPCASDVNGACGRIGALDAECGPMGGTVRHVKADASGEYLTIQHAINNCVDGDIVELADGTYIGTGNTDVNPLGLKIIIRSASGDSLACRIDAQNAHRGLVFNHGETPETTVQRIGIFNGAAATGAGIYCEGASPTLLSLYIADNNSTDDGGGVSCQSHASPLIENCTFENNTAADDGGGLYAYDWSSPKLDGCTFIGNLSTDRGGGTTFSVNCFPEISNCTYQGNEAGNGGGLIFVYAYGPVSNCVFVSNSAAYGGAVQCYGNAHADFHHCTMNDNAAANGACVYLRSNASPTFDSCILSFGRDGESMARYADDCNPILSCTDVHGNALGDWVAMLDGQIGVNGNFNADPLFCDRSAGILTLRGDSPCAVANNVECGQVGALAVGCSGSWLVRPDGSGDFVTIQEAIDAAAPAETVVLADGTFTGDGNRDLDFKGKEITLRSQSGDARQCIIDCQASQTDPHRGIYMGTGETENSILENITIKDAWMTYGAGMRIDNAHPVLHGVVFQGNQGGDGGGIIMGSGAAPRLEFCIFEDNSVSDAGGAIYVNASYPQILNCTFQRNSAYWGGGALYDQHAGPFVMDCVFEDNSSDHWGGAVHNRYTESGANFNDCLFTGNSAPQGGVVYNRDECYPSFTECTFAGNSSENGAVFHIRSNSEVNVIRSILVFSPTGSAVTTDGTATPHFICSDVYGNAGGDWVDGLAGLLDGTENFSLNPAFCDQYSGDYSLASNSLCVATNSPCGFQVGAFEQGCILTDVPETPQRISDDLVLESNVPNPFNPRTSIAFSIPNEGVVDVAIYRADGRRVTTLLHQDMSAGRHEVIWRGVDDRGKDVASGIYLVRVISQGKVKVGKLALVR